MEVVSGTTIISQNSIYNNGTRPFANGAPALGNIGIDLLANGEDSNLGNFPFVTLNSANAAGANNLLNYPILRTATLVGSSLVLTGYAKAGATIELFAAQPNPAALNTTGANFGQGRTYLATLTEGVNDASTSTGQSYGPGTINGFAQGKDVSANGFSFTIPLSALPGGTLAAGTVLTSTATLGGATSEFSGNVTAVAPLTGYVYEDVNYGGGAGRSFAALATPALGRAGARVELYTSNGAYFGRAITDVNGYYSFNAPVGTGYTVRVVNSSVFSGRAGATAASGSAAAGYVSNQLAVQTYNGTATHVGGANPALPDAAANTGSQTLAALKSATKVPQSVATTSVGTGPTNAGPDFGYNFDLVVNTNDSGQGSLRQFILNANALGNEAALTQSGWYTNARDLGTGSTAPGQVGVALPTGTESSIFMIPASQLTAGVAAIATTSALPQLNSANLAINGGTQTFNIGNTNNVLLGTGGTVGTAATSLSQLNGPEVQLKGNRTGIGLDLRSGADNATVRGLSIYGYEVQIGTDTDMTGTLIEQNVIGTTAHSFSDPGVGVRGPNEGIWLYNSDNGQVRENLIGYNGGMGIWVFGDASGANNNAITNNELRGNAQEVLVGTYPTEGLVFDGLELQGVSTGNLIAGNLITANLGHGIDSMLDGMGGNTITGNTISDNGQGIVAGTGVEGSGLRIYGATNTTAISHNVLRDNNGSGVLVMGIADKVLISQNAMSGNIRLGIDLLSTAEGNTTTTAYNGETGTTSNVSRNDNDDLDTGGNGLLNFPVITSAKVQGTMLLIAGYARPGVAIELFVASSAANGVAANQGFGQGQTYLGTFTEGSSDDTDATTGSYTGLVNGLDQGSDNTNKFAFKIPLTGRYAGVVPGTVLTSTATLGTTTSEFSGTATVTSAPLPVTLVSFTAQVVQNRAALLTWTTASELRNSHFEVERSYDGVAFGKLDNVAGRGTTATATTYTFTDAQPAATGTVYYRLRQVDIDDTATYSPVRSVRFAGEALRIGLAPNPATSTVALDLTTLPTGTYRVCVLDATGRILREQQSAAGLVHPLPLAGLPSGTYLVRVSSDALSLTKRLTKE